MTDKETEEIFEDEETIAIEKALNEGTSVEITRQPREQRIIDVTGKPVEVEVDGEEMDNFRPECC